MGRFVVQCHRPSCQVVLPEMEGGLRLGRAWMPFWVLFGDQRSPSSMFHPHSNVFSTENISSQVFTFGEIHCSMSSPFLSGCATRDGRWLDVRQGMDAFLGPFGDQRSPSFMFHPHSNVFSTEHITSQVSAFGEIRCSMSLPFLSGCATRDGRWLEV